MFVRYPRHLRLDPPLRTPCPVITGEVAISAELIASFYVRSPIAFHLSCLVLFAMISFVTMNIIIATLYM